jgi:hypothetical protein
MMKGVPVRGVCVGVIKMVLWAADDDGRCLHLLSSAAAKEVNTAISIGIISIIIIIGG